MNKWNWLPLRKSMDKKISISVHLDEVLKKMNVKRQAYHGKSFIGNHVHTCCKVTQILPLEKEFVESQNSVKLLRISFLVGRQYH